MLSRIFAGSSLRSPPRGHLLAVCSCIAVLALLLASGVTVAAETISCSYDARGRLVQVVRTDAAGNTVQTTYSYDQANNRTSVTTTGSMRPPPP
jgi:YD repeat-containing protein